MTLACMSCVGVMIVSKPAMLRRGRIRVVSLPECLHRKTVEAFHRVRRFFKDLEKSVDSRQFKNHSSLGRNSREFYVAVPFHCFFHAVQEHFDASAIQLPYLGKIKHEARPIALQQGRHFEKELLNVAQTYTLRQLFHGDSSASCHSLSFEQHFGESASCTQQIP